MKPSGDHDRKAVRALERELTTLGKRVEHRPVKVASRRKYLRYVRKLLLQETLANAIFTTLRRSMLAAPVVEEHVQRIMKVWEEHHRVVEKWIDRLETDRSVLLPLYRMAGVIMASTVFPRDTRRRVSFMSYVAGKHVDRITLTDYRLPDESARKVVYRILKEKGDALRVFNDFRIDHFSSSTTVEAQVKHLDRSLQKELEVKMESKTVPMEEKPNMVRANERASIPIARDDDILIFGK